LARSVPLSRFASRIGGGSATLGRIRAQYFDKQKNRKGENKMKIATAVLTVSLCLATSTFAQTAITIVTPTALEKHRLSFSVIGTPMTNETYFTISMSGTERRHLPKDYYATLRTEVEPASSVSTINGQTVRTRAKMDNEKGSKIAPSSTTTNQAGSVVYSFPVPNAKLANATFMFWLPSPRLEMPESCFQIDLKLFTEKK
jgi:hypothetical protein